MQTKLFYYSLIFDFLQLNKDLKNIIKEIKNRNNNELDNIVIDYIYKTIEKNNNYIETLNNRE